MNTYPCDCGDTHTSPLAVMYCAIEQEADDRAARRPPPAWRDSGMVRVTE